jgi:hypothetical protein
MYLKRKLNLILFDIVLVSPSGIYIKTLRVLVDLSNPDLENVVFTQ